MQRETRLQIHDLHIQCACTAFGTLMICVAVRAESVFRHENADYQCPNCGRGRRAFRVTHPIFGERIRFKRF